ncbi:hypothetical protein T492DRAFT_278108 [Pavlovales sp. CCMP2436]|nr:hypothetical protein T492DRAFT_278108 [Pavlovales sp. CCMP2436]
MRRLGLLLVALVGGSGAPECADRLARDEAAWREACVPAGSDAAARWRDYVELHAAARRGEYARVLVIQDAPFAQGVGNSVESLGDLFEHALMLRRALFINVTRPKSIALTGTGGSRAPRAEVKVMVKRFDPGDFFTGRDGVDWQLTGEKGDELARRWRAAGMQEEAVFAPGCTSRQIPQPVVDDLPPPLGSGAEGARMAASATWLSVSLSAGPGCYSSIIRTTASKLRIRPDGWGLRCRLGAFLRPRPFVEQHIRASLQSLATRSCESKGGKGAVLLGKGGNGGNGGKGGKGAVLPGKSSNGGKGAMLSEPHRLVSVQVRTGWADSHHLFDSSAARDNGNSASDARSSDSSSLSSWGRMEAAFNTMVDRARLSRASPALELRLQALERGQRGEKEKGGHLREKEKGGQLREKEKGGQLREKEKGGQRREKEKGARLPPAAAAAQQSGHTGAGKGEGEGGGRNPAGEGAEAGLRIQRHAARTNSSASARDALQPSRLLKGAGEQPSPRLKGAREQLTGLFPTGMPRRRLQSDARQASDPATLGWPHVSNLTRSSLAPSR